jgi:hypothetical protein
VINNVENWMWDEESWSVINPDCSGPACSWSDSRGAAAEESLADRAPPDGSMRPDENGIVGFALKSRLPSMYFYPEAVDAGGLMYYGAELGDITDASRIT